MLDYIYLYVLLQTIHVQIRLLRTVQLSSTTHEHEETARRTHTGTRMAHEQRKEQSAGTDRGAAHVAASQEHRQSLAANLHGEVGVQQLLDHLLHVLLLQEPAAPLRARRWRRGGGGGSGRGGCSRRLPLPLRGLHGRQVEPVQLLDERRGEERRGGGGGGRVGGVGGEVGARAWPAHDPSRLVVGARRVLRRLEGAQPYPRLPAKPTAVSSGNRTARRCDAMRAEERGLGWLRTGEGGGSRRPRSPSGAAARRGTVAAAGPSSAVVVDGGSATTESLDLPVVRPATEPRPCAIGLVLRPR